MIDVKRGTAVCPQSNREDGGKEGTYISTVRGHFQLACGGSWNRLVIKEFLQGFNLMLRQSPILIRRHRVTGIHGRGPAVSLRGDLQDG